jgi:copper homeostasis protein
VRRTRAATRVILHEVCADSFDGAVAAARAGARRIELCARLDLGGLTPVESELVRVLASVRVPVHVMIRPRAGDFVVSRSELATMCASIERAKSLGAHGAVFGALTADREIDVETTRRLVGAARPLAVTFHRAFDEVREPARALETLVELGVERVLTSGQAATALAGRAAIRALVIQAAGRIVVMAGGGVRSDHVAQLVVETGVREVHGSVPMAALPD